MHKNFLNIRISLLYNKSNKVSLKYVEAFKKILLPVPIEEAEILIVLGGDGELLQNLHKYMNLKIPFLGINTGLVGFLMNNIKIDKLNFLIKEILKLKKINLSPIEMIAFDFENKLHKALGFNDVYIFRQTNQAAHFKIKINGLTQIKKVISDGALVSTAAGSSAYNFSAGGNIIPIESRLLCLTALCPYRPRRWRGALLPQSSQVEFKILNSVTRPVNAVADFQEFKNIKKILIRSRKDISVKLLFTSKNNLENKIIQEQFKI
ncbi:MAG: NAD kinase [Rickettsia sp.]|nr:NAD kinase [Rickettsia sp.]